jgi:hypothetical protein
MNNEWPKAGFMVKDLGVRETLKILSVANGLDQKQRSDTNVANNLFDDYNNIQYK